MNEKKGLLKRLVADLKQDVSNLEATVERVSIEAIEAAGIVQSSFAEFNSLISSAQPEIFHMHSAFYIYHIDATFFSRRALEALCSYYGAAGSFRSRFATSHRAHGIENRGIFRVTSLSSQRRSTQD